MQADSGAEFVQRFQVAKPHLGRALAQAVVERLVAGCVEAAAHPERAVQTEHAVRPQDVPGQREHSPHGVQAHDMRRIGRIDSVERSRHERRRLAHVELQREPQPVVLSSLKPSTDPGVILPEIARLPEQVRHGGGKRHGMLPGARTDLEDIRYGRKLALQHFGDRRNVAGCRRGVRRVRHRRRAAPGRWRREDGPGTTEAPRSNRVCRTMPGGPSPC